VQTESPLSLGVNPLMVGTSEEMAPLAALLAALALLAASFEGCSRNYQAKPSACARARIGEKTVCVKPGGRCDTRYEHAYRSYGLTCRKGILRQHNYIGTPNP
jgi:hypothetical protein